MAFRVATFNTLASAYILPERYPNVPMQSIDANWRIPALLDYIAHIHADILCLQEVEPDVFHQLQHALPSKAGRYEKKGADRPDGCAIFVRPEKFQFCDSIRLEYVDQQRGLSSHSGSIAQLAVLGADFGNVHVANTHFRWDPSATPRAEKVGCRQCEQLLDLCSRFSESCSRQIICGDFNCEPTGDVLALLEAEGFHSAHETFRDIRTCVTGGRAKCIDYLCHRGKLLANPIRPPHLADDARLPSSEIPSDHVPLLAEFNAE